MDKRLHEGGCLRGGVRYRLTGDPESPEVIRTFCGGCGTSLTYWHGGVPDTVDVATASLDRPEAFPPTSRVWMEDRIGWERVDDGLPRFQQGGPVG